ncbi:ubiquitin carboxyl-terminal hydrolase 8 [Eupeodes corollae]|uniref:ubiquitin carboxyl-terminal hydrolase 8 n=1 Tax=Eupeodes corollae TaxID=290404 RepID=UPI0024912678|nr:ubiquitin carboxyl-terminal hydrolase 8 [Eupeodes corollae]
MNQHTKELYMGKSLRDLEKHHNLPDYRGRKITMLVSSARKLLEDAERCQLDGDEEQSYIQYMKFFNLLDCISKMPDYRQHKKLVKQNLGSNEDVIRLMNKLSKLTKSLQNRYKGLSENRNTMEMPELYDNENASNNSLMPHTFDLSSNNASNGCTADMNTFGVISCEELHRLIRNSGSLLIMDCRSKADFQDSHLSFQWCVNVPEEYIQAGISAGKLQDKLDNASKLLWAARSIKEQVVLMDWNCNTANPPPNSPIAILRDILQMWDPDVVYKSPIKILEKGYEYYILMYPSQCTNPSVQAPRVEEQETFIEEIEYPSILDITMKDDQRKDNNNTSVQKPSIDRSSKKAAIKTYGERQSMDILRDQELVAEKALHQSKLLLQAEGEIQTLSKSEHEEQTKLYYKMLQLQSAQQDLISDNNRLRQELEEVKRRENEQLNEKKSPKEVQTIEEKTKKIENVIQEQNKLQEKRDPRLLEKLGQELALEKKRRMTTPTHDDNEEMSRPKIPQFDRSVKPSVKTIERVRDFSPVPGTVGRGLTGLKNLGNTCYMNSILQCLSNTQPLTEYCLSDRYKNYISRANKTNGQVVEEVAALIKVLWNGNYKCVASKELRYVVGQYQKIFRGIEQQDSHEFLTILMDWLHSDLQTLQAQQKSVRENMPASERAWLEFTKARESLILRLFYGQIKSTVKCVYCNKESATYECFSNLSLELPSSANMCTLNQCMDMYFNGERIHGWVCPTCKQPREAIKKLDISKLPPILVVHFKRFYANPDSMGPSYRKKLNYVTFPLENLDMTPYVAKSELRSMSPKTYELYGVSNHYGSMESGHYTAFCKSGVFGKWFKFDDQVVSPIDTTDVVSSAGYILFYTWLPQTPPP